MKQKYLALIVMAALLCSGCSAKEESSVAGTDPTTEPSATDASVSWEGELTDEETVLHVTEEGRADFIRQYGEDAYTICMASVPLYLQQYQNSLSPVSDDDIASYRDAYTVQTMQLTSSLDGHTIPADYITDQTENRDTVILAHGAGQNRRKNNEQVDLFLSLGCNVLTFDQRCSGDNTAPLTTYGIWEQYDLLDCVRYVDGLVDSDKKITVYGKSMGGATVAALMGNPDAEALVDYAILDCPVVSMKQFIDQGIANHCPPEYIDATYEYGEAFMQKFLGFGFEDGEGAVKAADTKIPFLMFASKGDEMVAFEPQQQFFDAIQLQQKYLFTSETAKHCCVFSDENATYTELTKKLLNGTLFSD